MMRSGNQIKSKLLSVMVGYRVQILGMAVATIIIVLADLGLMPPASRGLLLLTGMILVYIFLGIGAGYAGARLLRTIKVT